MTAVVTRARLDAELVRRGLARSRQQAAELIEQGRVAVRGVPAGKPATVVDRDTPVTVQESGEREWASRGAHKLIGALDASATSPWPVPAASTRARRPAGSPTSCSTAAPPRSWPSTSATGSSSGGCAADDRVQVHDRTNVRTLSPDDIGGPVDLTVADLSFISLRTVLPALVACTRPGGELLPMVKPQFEVGRERLGAGGVVRDPELRRAALGDVAAAARELGLVLRDAVASPLPGPSGNVEFFLRLVRDAGAADVGDAVLDRAVEDGPR